MATKNIFQYLADFDKFLELYLVKKAPALPDNIKEIIVKYGPYLCLLFLITFLPILLGIFGISTFILPFSFLASPVAATGFSFFYLTSIAIFVLTIYALRGLFHRELKAWKIMYFVTIINAIDALFQFDLGRLLIGSLISFYFLFQIKPLYH